MEPIAHSKNTAGHEQPLLEHAGNVAVLAARFAGPFGSAPFAEWLGWWHDAGKVDEEVQAYLRGESVEARGPDHSSAGMLAATDLGTLWPLAFNVAGHHGGLPDHDALKTRIGKKKQDTRITEALALARPFVEPHVPHVRPADLPAFVRDEHASELWLRMLHSALVDADCLDTEAHFDPEQSALRGSEIDLRVLWDGLDADQQRLMAGSGGEVNAIRAEIYRACVERATLPPGVFSLTVPTGGGKTRSAMAFALRHALAHGLRRVIVALPYTSIIEQNADVYRALFGEAAVLEHHSAVVRREDAAEESEAETRARLAAENWDAPVVVTTTVQLLESLFASRNSRLRKLHRIARSVLVLDEVQTLPPHLLAPTLDVLRALVRDYGVTILLCTATPPALAVRDGLDGFEHVTELVADPRALAERLRRVRYDVRAEQWSWARVAGELRSAPQALVVLNTKRDATAVLDALGDTEAIFHLSTQLCGAHRRAVLAEVRRRLDPEQPEPVRLVSTQVVEAGVDLDFPLVLRALGPLDRIVQAAGRCNREGRMAEGRVVVFRPEEPGRLPPGAYEVGANATEAMLNEHPALDLADPESALAYFRRLYNRLDPDKPNVQRLRRGLSYEQTARAYRLMDDDAVPVVVETYDGGAKANAARTQALARVTRFGRASRQDFRALQPFVVNLRARAHRQAVTDSLCEEVAPESGVWRWKGDYHAPTPASGHGLIADIFLLTNLPDGPVI